MKFQAENVARAYFHVSSDQRHKEFITSEGNYETVKEESNKVFAKSFDFLFLVLG